MTTCPKPIAISSVISIQIPENAEPGDSLEFEAHGQRLELVVPEGSVPGDVLEIQMGGTTTTEDEPNNKTTNNDDSSSTPAPNHVTTIDLGHGLNLEFVSQLPQDYTYDQQDHGATPSEDNTTNNEDENENLTDGTFALPWQSGIELASHWKDISRILLKRGIQSQRRRILELGSGLGTVGVSLALTSDWSDDHPMHDPLIAKDATMILTDLPAAMPLLEFNVQQHRPKLSAPMILSAKPLRWTLEGEPDHYDSFSSSLTNEPPFDMIVGSDLLYNTKYIPHLIATMKRFLHPTRGIVVLAVRWRKPELERQFFQESGLDWELLPPDGITPGWGYSSLSWNEFGNASSEASNKYFHQTQISVNGQPQSLANITEEQAQGLPPQEFLAWERAFIQIYWGKPKESFLVVKESKEQ